MWAVELHGPYGHCIWVYVQCITPRGRSYEMTVLSCMDLCDEDPIDLGRQIAHTMALYDIGLEVAQQSSWFIQAMPAQDFTSN